MILEAELPGDARAPFKARALVANFRCGLTILQLADAMLAVSELVTSAFRRGDGRITLLTGVAGPGAACLCGPRGKRLPPGRRGHRARDRPGDGGRLGRRGGPARRLVRDRGFAELHSRLTERAESEARLGRPCPPAPRCTAVTAPGPSTRSSGRSDVVRTLRNAVEQDKVHHAYLFVGSRGTGKTSMAKILAACLNCEQGPTVDAVRRLRVVRLHRERDVAGRHRDGRGVEQLGRRHPRAARARRLRAGVGPPQGLHPRRGAHALVAGVERVPQDARGAAAAHDLRARHDRGAEGPADGRRPLPPLRLHAADRRADRRGAPPRRRRRRTSSCPPRRVALLARHATGSFRDALGTLEQLVDLLGLDDHDDDVLAVLGVADADLLFSALDAIAARDARAALLGAARLVDTGRDPDAAS